MSRRPSRQFTVSPPVDDSVLDLTAVAHGVVAELRAVPRVDGWGGELESIDVIRVGEGEDPWQSPEPGVRMTWSQGEHRFGLLVSMARLVEQSGDSDGVIFYLRLAMDEPHGPSPDGSRLWFLDLPSGVNWTPRRGAADTRAPWAEGGERRRTPWWRQAERPDYMHPAFLLPGLFLCAIWTPIWMMIATDSTVPGWLRLTAVPAVVLGVLLLAALIRIYRSLG